MVDVQWLLDYEWHVVVCDSKEEVHELLEAIEEQYSELQQSISLIPIHTDHYYRMRIHGGTRQICHGGIDFFNERVDPCKELRHFYELCGPDTLGVDDPPVEWLLGISN